MFTTKRGLGITAALALLLGLLVGQPTVSAQDDPPPAGATAAELDGANPADFVETYPGDGPQTQTAAANSDIEFVSLGTGCRFFDTRLAIGPLVNGVGRDYSVRTPNIPGQGGNGAGCGIPTSAVAVDLSLSTLANSPTGTGFARIGKGGTAPSATVLQYLKNQGTSVTTTSPLDGSDRVRVQVSGGNTGMTGDILGYWEDTLHATVEANGTLLRGSGVVTITHTSTSFYVVTFNRDVSTCTPVVAANTSNAAIVGTVLNGPPGQVYVRTRNGSAVDSDQPFRLSVEC